MLVALLRTYYRKLQYFEPSAGSASILDLSFCCKSSLLVHRHWRFHCAEAWRTLALEREPEWDPRRWRFYCAEVEHLHQSANVMLHKLPMITT
jgi:hypothetical protein